MKPKKRKAIKQKYRKCNSMSGPSPTCLSGSGSICRCTVCLNRAGSCRKKQQYDTKMKIQQFNQNK
jgi:4-diphosphocytidyl-2C-methyl-D-erythritol kinase